MKHKITSILLENKKFFYAKRYAANLMKTRGKKNCSEIAQATLMSHDRVQRDLNAATECSEEIRSALTSNILKYTRKNPGFLIGDGTLLVKEFAKKTEGVSLQHSGSSQKQGIGLMGIVWTDLERTYAVDCFTWKCGNQSRIKTATQRLIRLNQQVGALGVINDGAFASAEAIRAYNTAHVRFIMRFHSNRKILVPGYAHSQPMQIKEHPAFKMFRNQRYIIKKITWHDQTMYAVAIKIKHPKKGFMRLFLVTTMNIKCAKKIADLYTNRWKIEVFFRKVKQSFGLGDCLSRSLKKQEAHCLAVFLAYNLVHYNENLFSFSSQNSLPIVKKRPSVLPIARSDLNFCASA